MGVFFSKPSQNGVRPEQKRDGHSFGIDTVPRQSRKRKQPPSSENDAPSKRLALANGANVEHSTTNNARGTRKRKMALYVIYDGANYAGWQRNKGVRTVTDEVEEALHSVGLISATNVGELKKVSWMAAARTDKGVSAAGNVVSFRGELPKDDSEAPAAMALLTKKMNEHLPPQVRALRLSVATNSFNARLHCDGRSYEYLLNMSCFAKNETNSVDDTEILKRLDTILRRYEGSHFFHNYTVGKVHVIPPLDTTRRYMRSVRCDLVPFILRTSEGVAESRWARIRIRGQSFMLHQIRKMVSMAVLIYIGKVPEDAIERSFSETCLNNIPPAPSTGLYLDYVDFSNYNRRQKRHLRPVTHTDVEEVREKFKNEFIFPSIARRNETREDMRKFFAVVDQYASSWTQMVENNGTRGVPTRGKRVLVQ